MVRRKPKFSPDVASITLFGPGVIELTSANRASGPSSDREVRGTSAQLAGIKLMLRSLWVPGIRLRNCLRWGGPPGAHLRVGGIAVTLRIVIGTVPVHFGNSLYQLAW